MLPDDGQDLYALLQVHPKASPEVIKKAYYTLMQKNHPDRGGDLQLAKQINQAYDILIDTAKRERYDQQRFYRQARRARQEELERKHQAKQAAQKAAQKAQAKAAQGPPQIRQLKGEYQSPMLWGDLTLVSDERGNRVLILDRKGETVWTYGKNRGEKLSKPRLAQFSPDGQILIADTGQQRVLKVNLKKEQLWEYAYQNESPQVRAQAQPVFLHALANAPLLITDTGHRKVLAVNEAGKVLWEFNGKAGFSLSFQHQLIQQELFMPVSAFVLGQDRYLIADQGNGRIFEINHRGKLLWIYPDKKQPALPAINFAYRLPGGNTWISSDKIIEISMKGEILWHFARLADADIKQAYPLPDSTFILDFSHLVKRGINQEVMRLDHNGKVQYRHYYSQHRFL